MGSSSVAVIIVAAGSGTRLGQDKPKAFVQLGDQTMLDRAVMSALGMRNTPHIVLVVPEGRAEEVHQAYTHAVSVLNAGLDVVEGGATRQESVGRGLELLPRYIDTVLVHDAARPLTPSLLFDEVAQAVRSRGHGIVPALDLVDTIKRVDADKRVVDTVDRSMLAAGQTPQGFPRAALERAYATTDAEFTDDAALVASIGFPVDVVPGDARAFKITVPADLQRAERLVGEWVRRDPRAAATWSAPRVGTGMDVHAFSDDPDTPLWVAGLEWPGGHGLAGHSDGDVASHAIVDALLAAAGLGDLGSNFGTEDPRFEGAHGTVLLRRARELVDEAGYGIVNVSVQVIGNRPRLGPRRAEAESVLGRALGVRVSVSATTTDALGFTGRGEGLAAIATATLLPD